MPLGARLHPRHVSQVSRLMPTARKSLTVATCSAHLRSDITIARTTGDEKTLRSRYPLTKRVATVRAFLFTVVRPRQFDIIILNGGLRTFPEAAALATCFTDVAVKPTVRKSLTVATLLAWYVDASSR
jgi:hypothetical protein